jgi:hypothetical protein
MQNLRRSLLSLSHEPAIKILLEEDKDIISATRNLGKEIGDSAAYLRKYGETQHFDLKDITDNLSFISKHIEKSLTDLASNLQKYRENLKSIKKQADEMYDLQMKAKIAADKLKKAESQQNKPADVLKSLKREAEEADVALLQYEAAFEANKRALFKDGLINQFQGYQDLGVKLQTIGHFGKCLANQIPQGELDPGDEMPIYLGAPTTKKIKEDFIKAFSRETVRSDQSPKFNDTVTDTIGRKNSLQQSGLFSQPQDQSSSPNLLSSQPSLYQQYQQAPLRGSLPPTHSFQFTNINPPPMTLPARYTNVNQSFEKSPNKSVNSNTNIYAIKTPDYGEAFGSGYTQSKDQVSHRSQIQTCEYCQFYVLANDMSSHLESKCRSFCFS